ncbi:glycosyltransferase family 1 protein [Sporolactobacillus sp. CQH2019]|uniref:glycosyltransferase family 4 protein n=1 Tax=Sporolactobacillus sp. CQH2019 TaxID=3023512 RepID=UPI0023675434|nr:glycosyltransferase family 1 protein [Sporolactobacillus sp. CQH2019]MDD9148712.1 glycosyltransferase family 1 protein [Sporolactobacillus sp. CQH2019]
MRIAIFTDTFTPQVNGVAKTLERLTRYLNKTGIGYTLFAPQNVREEHKRTNIQKVKSIPFAVYPECRFAVPNPYFVRRKLLQFQPDLIHVATPFNMGLLGRYYARKLDIPLVGSYHTDFDAYLAYYKMELISPILWNYLRWFHNSLQKTFVPSPATFVQLKDKGFHSLAIWGRGVDCGLFHPDNAENAIRREYGIAAEHILSFAGRLAPEKDIATLQKVMKNINGKMKNHVHWLIAGDGPLYSEFKAKFSEHVTFTGYLPAQKLAQVFAASDLMVFPSATETFGNVVLESLACGTPVIGANAGGVKNILVNHKTGILCTPQRVNEFTSAVSLLLRDHLKRREMSQAARRYALTQSWDQIFEKLLDDYADVVGHSAGSFMSDGLTS